MESNSIRVLMASGGSGGHIFPGIHIADALCQSGDATVTFVGVGRPVEERIVANAGYELRVIRTSGLKGLGIGGLLKFLASIPSAFVATWKLFSDVRPHAVVATGGYASFFPMLVGFLRGVPRWLHEAERKPGLANTVLSLIATRVSLAFEAAKMPFWAHTLFTGHPVRSSLADLRSASPASDVPVNVLIIGGSQGAQALDAAAATLAEVFAEKELAVWHQCRPTNESEVRDAYDKAAVSARVMPFIDDVAVAYAWSDIIIARSGAGTVSELSVVNRPVIFVPFPHAQGNHQEANAMLLVEQQKALLVKEGEQFAARLKEAFLELISVSRYQEMRDKEVAVPSLHAASVIAKQVRTLICSEDIY